MSVYHERWTEVDARRKARSCRRRYGCSAAGRFPIRP